MSLIFLISQPVREFCRNELAGEIEFVLLMGGRCQYGAHNPYLAYDGEIRVSLKTCMYSSFTKYTVVIRAFKEHF